MLHNKSWFARLAAALNADEGSTGMPRPLSETCCRAGTDQLQRTKTPLSWPESRPVCGTQAPLNITKAGCSFKCTAAAAARPGGKFQAGEGSHLLPSMSYPPKQMAFSCRYTWGGWMMAVAQVTLSIRFCRASDRGWSRGS